MKIRWAHCCSRVTIVALRYMDLQLFQQWLKSSLHSVFTMWFNITLNAPHISEWFNAPRTSWVDGNGKPDTDFIIGVILWNDSGKFNMVLWWNIADSYCPWENCLRLIFIYSFHINEYIDQFPLLFTCSPMYLFFIRLSTEPSAKELHSVGMPFWNELNPIWKYKNVFWEICIVLILIESINANFFE